MRTYEPRTFLATERRELERGREKENKRCLSTEEIEEETYERARDRERGEEIEYAAECNVPRLRLIYARDRYASVTYVA